MDGRMEGWMDEQMGGRMSRLVDEWMDGYNGTLLTLQVSQDTVPTFTYVSFFLSTHRNFLRDGYDYPLSTVKETQKLRLGEVE